MSNNDQAPLMGRRQFTFDRVVRIIIGLALIAGGIWLLRRLSSVLLPFLVAWLMAYLLEPLVQKNRRLLRTKGRFWAIVITLVEVVLMLTVLGIVFIPSIIEEMHQVAELVRQYASTTEHADLLPTSIHEFLKSHIDFRSIYDHLTHQDMQSILSAAASLVSGGVGIILDVVSWFIVLLYLVFIMIDYDKLILGFRHIVPPRYRKPVFAVFTDVKNSMNHYFRGQSLIALIVGILFSIGFLIVGLPLAVVLGLFIGLLNMVPYMQLLSIPITTLLCLVYSVQGDVSFWPTWWACMAVYVVVQCFQDLFLTPKIMGREMGLNPAIILLSLSVWGSLLGFIGLIIALPLTTLVLAYYNRYIINREQCRRTCRLRGRR